MPLGLALHLKTASVDKFFDRKKVTRAVDRATAPTTHQGLVRGEISVEPILLASMRNLLLLRWRLMTIPNRPGPALQLGNLESLLLIPGDQLAGVE